MLPQTPCAILAEKYGDVTSLSGLRPPREKYHESRLAIGRVAQLAEHSTLNRLVVGSIPTASTTLF